MSNRKNTSRSSKRTRKKQEPDSDSEEVSSEENDSNDQSYVPPKKVISSNINKTPKKRQKVIASEDSEQTKIKVKNYPPCNIFKYYRNYEMGLPCYQYKKPLKDLIINYCKTFKLYKVESPFDRRVTFIVWHPTNPKLVSVTSHGGDVVLYNYEQDINSAYMIKGIGAGGSVQSMKFDPSNPTRIYSASMEGKFLLLDFLTKKAIQFLETNDINRWYISLDVNSKNNLMVAGDTKGSLTVLTLQGDIIARAQLHKKGFKISHTEFSKREPWLLCTSSTDSSIKLWDIRKLKSDLTNVNEPLQKIQHEKPLNAAYFSLTDGCRLLTTDQYDKIKIYRAPLWQLETVINHPHRQFQHLTPIKAYWHPYEDIVFVGRYPCKKFPGYYEGELRTLDFFDADTGELLHQHYENGFNGILSLNRFNVTGDALASSYGTRFLIWKPNFSALDKKSKRQDRIGRKENGKKDDDSDNEDDESDGEGGGESTVNWNALLKKQSKDKKELKGKKPPVKKKGSNSKNG